MQQVHASNSQDRALVHLTAELWNHHSSHMYSYCASAWAQNTMQPCHLSQDGQHHHCISTNHTHFARSAAMLYSARGLQGTLPLVAAAAALEASLWLSLVTEPCTLTSDAAAAAAAAASDLGERCSACKSCSASSMLCWDFRPEAPAGCCLRAAAACCCCLTVGVLDGAREIPTVGRPAAPTHHTMQHTIWTL